MDWYDTAQICLNGHLINDSIKEYPQHNQNHCDKCGEKTITTCGECNAEIRGDYHCGVVGGLPIPVPSFCRNCGKPYPWTEAKMKAAKELTELAENLTNEEKIELSKSLDDLVKDSPKTQVAVIKFKKYIGKAGQAVGAGIKAILIEVATEAVKKQLWP